jgi:hypothetical protein
MIVILWVFTPCSKGLLQCFIGTYCLHLQGHWIRIRWMMKSPWNLLQHLNEPDSVTLKMEAACSSKTSARTITTGFQNPNRPSLKQNLPWNSKTSINVHIYLKATVHKMRQNVGNSISLVYPHMMDTWSISSLYCCMQTPMGLLVQPRKPRNQVAVMSMEKLITSTVNTCQTNSLTCEEFFDIHSIEHYEFFLLEQITLTPYSICRNTTWGTKFGGQASPSDNALAHSLLSVCECMAKNKITVISHPRCSPV